MRRNVIVVTKSVSGLDVVIAVFETVESFLDALRIEHPDVYAVPTDHGQFNVFLARETRMAEYHLIPTPIYEERN